jgi:hypothetical protein
MTQHYTSNDLVRFIYKETDKAESAAILQRLNVDEEFKNAYADLLQGFNQLSQPKCSPKLKTENFILQYSQR